MLNEILWFAIKKEAAFCLVIYFYQVLINFILQILALILYQSFSCTFVFLGYVTFYTKGVFIYQMAIISFAINSSHVIS